MNLHIAVNIIQHKKQKEDLINVTLSKVKILLMGVAIIIIMVLRSVLEVGSELVIGFFRWWRRGGCWRGI